MDYGDPKKAHQKLKMKPSGLGIQHMSSQMIVKWMYFDEIYAS